MCIVIKYVSKNQGGFDKARFSYIDTIAKCRHLFTFSHREGKRGGGELNQREGERGNTGEYISQSWVANTNITECTQEIGYKLG